MTFLKEIFFSLPTLQLAQSLLGMHLVHESRDGITVGKIVETEAYLCDDEACHASRGKTKRTAVMFGPPGHAYIYFIYGKYFCFNVVSAAPGVGEAVLIRALEPVAGIELMRQRRKTENLLQLCSGPAKLVMAMGIEKSQNGVSLINGPLRIEPTVSSNPPNIIATTRIGISKATHLEYRYYLRDNKFISKT